VEAFQLKRDVTRSSSSPPPARDRGNNEHPR